MEHVLSISEHSMPPLFKELRQIASQIPEDWGGQIQNNRSDRKVNVFRINTFEELLSKIAGEPREMQDYFKRRWFLTKCADCDEQLFAGIPGCERNPDRYDKSWDIRFKCGLEFDVKGTQIPKPFRNDVEKIIDNPDILVEYMYKNQSKETRFGLQNRLFIIHHSFVDFKRETLLRCAWQTKEKAYVEFSEHVQDYNLPKFGNAVSGLIYILEKERGKAEFYIPELKI